MRRTTIGLALVLAATTLGGIAPGAPVSAASASTASYEPDDLVRSVPLPQGATRVGQLSRAGDKVYAVLSIEGALHVMETTDGSRGWNALRGQDPAQARGVTAAAAGVTAVLHQRSDGTYFTSVVGPRGSWTTPEVVDEVGAGGNLVLSDYEILDAATGQQVDTPASGTRVALADDTWWRFDVNGGRLTSQRKGEDPAPGPRLTGCPRGLESFDVQGRWALVVCGDATMSPTVYDLSGELQPLYLPLDAYVPVLTSGAVQYTTGSTTYVVGLGAEGPVRRPSSGLKADSEGAGFVSSRTSSTADVTLVDLALAPAAVDDVTAPAVTLDAVPEWIPTESLRVSWTVADQGDGPRSGASRVELGLSSTSTQQPTSVRSAPAAPASTVLYLGSGRTCVRARAVDRRGNTSAWGAPTCPAVDSWGPDTGTSAITPVVQRDGTTDITFAFAASDDYSGLDRREVQVRRWSRTQTGTPAWGATKVAPKGRFTVTLAAGARACFKGRGVDRVGNVGAWGEMVCSSGAYDESKLRFHGPTSLVRYSTAQGGTARRMSGDSWFSIRSEAAGNCVTLRLLATKKGTGSLEGSINGRGGGRWTDDVPGTWFYSQSTYRSVCGKGTIVIRHARYATPVTIDMVALTRNGDHGYEW